MCFTCTARSTDIVGVIRTDDDQLIWPSIGDNLVLILRHDQNEEEVHHLQLNIDQQSFPGMFAFPLPEEIEENGYYLITLLIFGFPHRLLWECTFLRSELKVNEDNHIHFTVTNVCE